MKTGILRRTSQTLFLPTNILFRLVKVVFTKDKIYKVSANQEQGLPMAAIFFPEQKEMRNFHGESAKHYLYKQPNHLDYNFQMKRFSKFQETSVHDS